MESQNNSFARLPKKPAFRRKRPIVSVNLSVVISYILCLAGSLYLTGSLIAIELQMVDAPDAVSFAYRIKYALIITSGIFICWHLIASITSTITGQGMRPILIKYAWACITFLAVVIAAGPAKASLVAQVSLIPPVTNFLSRASLASAQDDAVFLAAAMAPSFLVLMAIGLGFLRKAHPRYDQGILFLKIVFSLILMLGMFIGWWRWRDSVFHRGRGGKNILFITCDAMVPDHLGCYGYHRDTTPFLNQLAKEGTVFTNFVAVSSWGMPSYKAIYSSRCSSYYNESVLKGGLRESALNMAQLLADENCYVKAFLTSPDAAEAYSSSKAQLGALNHSVETAILTDRALDMLAENKEKQLFIHLQYADPLDPYTPPEPYDKLFVDPEAETGEFSRRVSLYDGEIAHLDFQISRLVKKLKELGIYECTYIVFTASHGEGIDGYCGGHGSSLDNELVRVPLIICGPGIPKNKKIDFPASHVDLLPTFVEWMRGEPDSRCQGKSLEPLISGEEKESRIAFSELYYPHTAPRYHLVSAQMGPWKLITGDPRGDMLFNVKEDPLEEINLAAREQEIFLTLKTEIDRFKKNSQEPVSSLPGSSMPAEN